MQGSITKAGNAHVRRLLIEAAWHHRAVLSQSRADDAGPLGQGRPGLEGPRARREPRLHQQWCRFNERKKHHMVANVAIARELAGWCWSLATLN